MLLRSVPGVAACPQTCCIHQCFGTRSGPAARIPGRLLSRKVWHRTPSAISRLLPRSRPLLRQVPLDGGVVFPTALPIGTRGKDAGLRSRMRYDLRVPACTTAVYPPAIVARYLYRLHSCPPGRQLGHPGPVRSKRMARPSPLLLYYIAPTRKIQDGTNGPHRNRKREEREEKIKLVNIK